MTYDCLVGFRWCTQAVTDDAWWRCTNCHCVVMNRCRGVRPQGAARRHAAWRPHAGAARQAHAGPPARPSVRPSPFSSIHPSWKAAGFTGRNHSVLERTPYHRRWPVGLCDRAAAACERVGGVVVLHVGVCALACVWSSTWGGGPGDTVLVAKGGRTVLVMDGRAGGLPDTPYLPARHAGVPAVGGAVPGPPSRRPQHHLLGPTAATPAGRGGAGRGRGRGRGHGVRRWGGGQPRAW